MFTVALQGNIGSGKSSLLAALRDHPAAAGAVLVPEPVAEWEPWLRRYYGGRSAAAPAFPDVGTPPGGGDGRALGLQLQVLASLHRKRRELPLSARLVIFERSPISSRKLFVERMMEKGEMDDLEKDLYDNIYATLGWAPTVDVYLRCPPATCLRRIRERGRTSENSIELPYLEELHQKHDTLYAGCGVVLDGDLSSKELADQLMARLMAHAATPPPRPDAHGTEAAPQISAV